MVESTETSKVHTSVGEPPLLKDASKRWILITVGIVIIAGGVIGGLMFHKHQQAVTKAKNDPYSVYQEQQVALAHKSVDQTKSKDKATRAKAYEDLGSSYLNVNKPKDALKAFQTALSIDPNAKRQTFGGIMMAYSMEGEKQKAIDTANAAIAYLKTIQGDDTTSASIQAYQNSIKQLQSGGSL